MNKRPLVISEFTALQGTRKEGGINSFQERELFGQITLKLILRRRESAINSSRKITDIIRLRRTPSPRLSQRMIPGLGEACTKTTPERMFLSSFWSTSPFSVHT